MRLLHTTTLEFKEFFDSEVPRYAILSHRWGDEEVGFKDIRNRTARPGPALRKIERCCRLAASRRLNWVWIDTCCIDKRSSAELSEAINSMFKWYERARLCLVYLSDIQIYPAELSRRDSQTRWRWLGEQGDLRRRFTNSRWFTRGWTLQELLAPRALTFFDAEWIEIGTRADLAREVSNATRIPITYSGGLWGKVSVAEKMSFAAHRTTSREEDIAYCLLGLFDVAMPLLYGEGAYNAFQRLQIEIMNKSSDESLFAWKSNEPASGMLAPNPSCFADSGDIIISSRLSKRVFRRPFTMSNIGLEFPVPDHLPQKGIIPIYLNCHRSVDRSKIKALCIQLRVQDNVAFRIRCDLLDAVDYPQRYKQCNMQDLDHEIESTRTVYVRQPDKVEVEYSRILTQLEEGKILLTELPIVATADKGIQFLNPGPISVAADSRGRILDPGRVSSLLEARAEMCTHTALMAHAAFIVHLRKWKDAAYDEEQEALEYKKELEKTTPKT